MAESLRRTVAKLMLSRTQFAGDTVSPDTIWRAQHPEVRDFWLERADGFLADLADRGLRIEQV